MWNVKTKPIPVIRVAPGTISKTFRKNVNSIDEQQKMAIMDTVHILRQVLMYKYTAFNSGEIALYVP